MCTLKHVCWFSVDAGPGRQCSRGGLPVMRATSWHVFECRTSMDAGIWAEEHKQRKALRNSLVSGIFHLQAFFGFVSPPHGPRCLSQASLIEHPFCSFHPKTGSCHPTASLDNIIACIPWNMSATFMVSSRLYWQHLKGLTNTSYLTLMFWSALKEVWQWEPPLWVIADSKTLTCPKNEMTKTDMCLVFSSWECECWLVSSFGSWKSH